MPAPARNKRRNNTVLGPLVALQDGRPFVGGGDGGGPGEHSEPLICNNVAPGEFVFLAGDIVEVPDADVPELTKINPKFRIRVMAKDPSLQQEPKPVVKPVAAPAAVEPEPQAAEPESTPEPEPEAPAAEPPEEPEAPAVEEPKAEEPKPDPKPAAKAAPKRNGK